MSRRDEIELTWTNQAGETITHSFPAHNQVCSRCQGYGTHLNPSIGNHAYTPEEFNEAFDEEGQEEYFRRGGIYDVQCENCHGNKVILVVSDEILNRTQAKLYGEYLEHEEKIAREAAQDARTSWYEDGCPQD